MFDYKSFLKTIFDKVAESIVLLLICVPGTILVTTYCSDGDKAEETAKKNKETIKLRAGRIYGLVNKYHYDKNNKPLMKITQDPDEQIREIDSLFSKVHKKDWTLTSAGQDYSKIDSKTNHSTKVLALNHMREVLVAKHPKAKPLFGLGWSLMDAEDSKDVIEFASLKSEDARRLLKDAGLKDDIFEALTAIDQPTVPVKIIKGNKAITAARVYEGELMAMGKPASSVVMEVGPEKGELLAAYAPAEWKEDIENGEPVAIVKDYKKMARDYSIPFKIKTKTHPYVKYAWIDHESRTWLDNKKSTFKTDKLYPVKILKGRPTILMAKSLQPDGYPEDKRVIEVKSDKVGLNFVKKFAPEWKEAFSNGVPIAVMNDYNQLNTPGNSVLLWEIANCFKKRSNNEAAATITTVSCIERVGLRHKGVPH